MNLKRTPSHDGFWPVFFRSLWDLLAWLLVIFPFLTGGIWISRPGLFIELSELGVPVILMGVFGGILQGFFHISLTETSSVRMGRALGSRWSEWLKTSPRQALWITAGIWGALGTLASLRRHQAFGSHAFDLGIFTNALWNLTHGLGYVSSVKGGMNLFSDHQSPLFWLFAPFFSLFPDPKTLLVLQAFGLASGGVAVYSIARSWAPSPGDPSSTEWSAAVLPWLYWLYLPFRNANAFDFHPEVLMLPLFLAAIAGLQSTQTRSRIGGALALILALGAKESAGPVAAGIGLAWILGAGPKQTQRFTRWMGLGFAALGTTVFILDTQVVPQLLGAKYGYHSLYSQYGDRLGDLLLLPFQKPGLLLEQLFGAERRRFLLWTLAPLGFLPLLHPTGALAALPGYLMLFLTQGKHRVDLHYHYAIEPGVGLFLAMPGALFRLQTVGQSSLLFRFIRFLPLWLLFWALAASGRSELFRIRKFTPDAHSTYLSNQVLPCLHPSTPWVASETLVPHLATRHWIQAEDLALPAQPRVSCWITDRKMSHWPLSSAEAALQKIPADFDEIWRCGSVSVFQRKSFSEDCLSCRPSCAD